MSALINKQILLTGLCCAGLLGACQKPAQEVCTSRGLVAGSADFDDCMSTLKKKAAAIEAQQERDAQNIKAAASLAGRWGSGCRQNMAKMDCNYGD